MSQLPDGYLSSISIYKAVRWYSWRFSWNFKRNDSSNSDGAKEWNCRLPTASGLICPSALHLYLKMAGINMTNDMRTLKAAREIAMFRQISNQVSRESTVKPSLSKLSASTWKRRGWSSHARTSTIPNDYIQYNTLQYGECMTTNSLFKKRYWNQGITACSEVHIVYYTCGNDVKTTEHLRGNLSVAPIAWPCWRERSPRKSQDTQCQVIATDDQRRTTDAAQLILESSMASLTMA